MLNPTFPWMGAHGLSSASGNQEIGTPDCTVGKSSLLKGAQWSQFSSISREVESSAYTHSLLSATAPRFKISGNRRLPDQRKLTLNYLY